MDAQSEKLLAHIIRNTRVASLATLRDDAPQVSMVAYVTNDDFSLYHIFVSRLAQHTVDMQKDKRVALLIAEPDDSREDPQTLARVSIRGTAEVVQNGEPGYTPLRDQYLARFPQAEQLFQLADFNFWRIKPKGGRFVAGFAKAYNITPETLKKVSSR
ncbi:MAG: pyridoxamine 5'-phosphate oxidase family protein [Anaerolineales bacterium]|nr:pyridoxamine 5'-phosphate oxidase family protein [Anaerolineales bacterium]WKZ42154.1 MAG: pyridoxamine 5'-phosphate oxidase family protein [Anaerolineales bacterium]